MVAQSCFRTLQPVEAKHLTFSSIQAGTQAAHLSLVVQPHLLLVHPLQLVEAKLKKAQQEGQAAREAGLPPLAAGLKRLSSSAASDKLPEGATEDPAVQADACMAQLLAEEKAEG